MTETVEQPVKAGAPRRRGAFPVLSTPAVLERCFATPERITSMSRIACLHTAESNIAVFEAALRAIGPANIELLHTVRADLLAAAEREGQLTASIKARTIAFLQGLCARSDVVLLTCSTLGPSADAAAEGARCPILRVDAALASEAVRTGGRVVVLCAIETTIEPTRQIFERAAQASEAEIVIQLVPGAWDAFRSGDHGKYFSMIARASEDAMRAGAARVALAQASMAGASDLVPAEIRPLNSPAAGLAAAIAALC